MIDTKLQKAFQRGLLPPLIQNRWASRVDPKNVTLAAFFFGLMVPLFLSLGLGLASLISLALSGLCDTLDGAIARQYAKTSDWGAFLDIVSDRTVEFATLFGLYLVSPQTRGLLSLLMLGAILLCVTTFLVEGIFSSKKSEKSFYYSPGLIERGEAFLFFGMMIAFPEAFHGLAITFTVLVTLTGLKRMKEFCSAHR